MPQSTVRVVIDIGNSHTKLGLFRGSVLQEQARLVGAPWPEIQAWLTNHQAVFVILSTVAQAPPAVEWWQHIPSLQRWWILDATTPLPFRSAYRTPATLGKDRVAAVAGAQALYPGRDCLVVDAGTCMTSDLLTADGVYQGGNISPGVQMRLRAMHEQTARLPLVTVEATDYEWGIDTASALRNGGVLGTALELEGLWQRWRQQWPHLSLVLTGGDAPLLAKLLQVDLFLHPELVLYGLNEILSYNVDTEE